MKKKQTQTDKLNKPSVSHPPHMAIRTATFLNNVLKPITMKLLY